MCIKKEQSDGTIKQVFWTLIEILACMCVCLALLPVLTGLYQFLLLAFSFTASHLSDVKPYLPNVSILIPAWNEEAVVGHTIESLMKLNYPAQKLHICVVDDASTDQTPDIVQAKIKKYPGNVFHFRREQGGKGKAHTLNFGLKELWKSDWTQAVLIMDADVIYTPDSLQQMARHLADDNIGAVTAYIKEGSQDPNYVQRYVRFEYITATGASRRAQNVMGFLACLSGGAQLHSRENLLAIGGQIFDDTLAEDTFTTFKTQLSGRKAIFEANAIVYAEEPDGLVGLWKQRLRWARGNIQITKVYWNLWFRRDKHKQMGSLSMALIWFSIFLMPVLQILASVSLLSLFWINANLAWQMFQAFWIVAALVYVFVTLASFVVDSESAAKSWFQGFLFPGIISLNLIAYSLWPPILDYVYMPLMTVGMDVLYNLKCHSLIAFLKSDVFATMAMVFLYSWLSLSMLGAWLAKCVESTSKALSRFLLNISGFGSFLCAVTFAAYIKEWQGADKTWDKTVKTGKVA